LRVDRDGRRLRSRVGGVGAFRAMTHRRSAHLSTCRCSRLQCQGDPAMRSTELVLHRQSPALAPCVREAVQTSEPRISDFEPRYKCHSDCTVGNEGAGRLTGRGDRRRGGADGRACFEAGPLSLSGVPPGRDALAGSVSISKTTDSIDSCHHYGNGPNNYAVTRLSTDRHKYAVIALASMSRATSTKWVTAYRGGRTHFRDVNVRLEESAFVHTSNQHRCQ
jgi:hypothetical protein